NSLHGQLPAYIEMMCVSSEAAGLAVLVHQSPLLPRGPWEGERRKKERGREEKGRGG
ncbi:hypothetical protein H8959_022600, partial [Pygathrix nigripes]